MQTQSHIRHQRAWSHFDIFAAGAPEHLVQIVTGYAEAGNALVTSGVNKLIFVVSS